MEKLKKFFESIINFLSTGGVSGGGKTVVDIPKPKPADPIPVKNQQLTSEDVIKAVEKGLFKDHGKQETNGPNRAGWIDTINNWIGAKLGSSYCISGQLYNLYCVEKELGIKFDLPKTASTQTFYKLVKEEYKVKEPKRGCIGIMRVIKDPAHGHAVYTEGKADSKGYFLTFEYNTDGAGSRNGDGAWHTTRHLDGDSSKVFLGYVDLSKCWKKI